MAARKPAPWKGNFGVTIEHFGFATTWNDSTWTVSLADLKALRAAGIDHIRLAVSPTYLAGAGDVQTMRARLAAPLAAMTMCLQAGLKVLWNNHVSLTDAAFKSSDILADFPNGPKFRLHVQVLTMIALAVRPYGDRVAIAPHNEREGTVTNLPTIIAYEVDYIRKFNKTSTIMVTGDGTGSLDNITNLKLDTEKDRLVVPYFFCYKFEVFSQQSVAGAGADLASITGALYPPSWSQTTALKAGATPTGDSLIDLYMDNPGNANARDYRFIRSELLNWKTWVGTNKRKGYLAEVGAATLAGGGGKTSVLAWLHDMVREYKLLADYFCGISIWTYGPDSNFGLTSGSGAIDDDYYRAFDLKPVSGTHAKTSTLVSYLSGASITALTSAQLAAMDQLFTLCAEYSITFDGLWIAGMAATEAQSFVNLWAPGTFNLTKTGSPTFTAFDKWTGDGASGYLDSGINWSSSTLSSTLTNRGLGIWKVAGTNTSNRDTADSGSLNNAINIRQGVADVFVSHDGSFSQNWTATNSDIHEDHGHYSVDRSASGNIVFSCGGIDLQTITQTAAGAGANATYKLLYTGSGGAASSLRAAWVSPAMDATKKKAWFSILYHVCRMATGS